ELSKDEIQKHPAAQREARVAAVTAMERLRRSCVSIYGNEIAANVEEKGWSASSAKKRNPEDLAVVAQPQQTIVLRCKQAILWCTHRCTHCKVQQKGLATVKLQALVYLARPKRFELLTPWFVAKYSIQL